MRRCVGSMIRCAGSVYCSTDAIQETCPTANLADFTGLPTRLHELDHTDHTDHTDQEYICPE